METAKKTYEKIENLKDGEHCYFNMFQDGRAVCYKCNGMYLLFEISSFGDELYKGAYFKNQLNDLIEYAFNSTRF